jgi:dTDP-4-amino-4,6-dideoxygalactose transaminase
MANMTAIMDIARRRGLTVIEDAAQAHGAECGGRRAGSIGHIGCFSFYPGKNLGAYGEGGAIVTSDPQAEKTIRCLRDWGQSGKYNHVLKGFNYRMDAIQAAVLNVKMRYIEEWTEARRAHAARYDKLLAPLGIQTPPADHLGRHVYHVYAVRIRGRDEVQRRLEADGIATGIHYPVPVHLQPAYSDLGFEPGDLPVSERVATEVLSLPMYAELADEQVDAVVKAVASQVGGRTSAPIHSPRVRGSRPEELRMPRPVLGEAV